MKLTHKLLILFFLVFAFQSPAYADKCEQKTNSGSITLSTGEIIKAEEIIWESIYIKRNIDDVEIKVCVEDIKEYEYMEFLEKRGKKPYSFYFRIKLTLKNSNSGTFIMRRSGVIGSDLHAVWFDDFTGDKQKKGFSLSAYNFKSWKKDKTIRHIKKIEFF